jgi:hypothetical protein
MYHDTLLYQNANIDSTHNVLIAIFNNRLILQVLLKTHSPTQTAGIYTQIFHPERILPINLVYKYIYTNPIKYETQTYILLI